MRATTVRFSERVWRWLVREAREEGITVSEFLREGAMMRLGHVLGERRLGRRAEAPDAEREAPDLDLDDVRAVEGAVLDYLHRRLGFSLWLVARVEGEDWVVEQARDEGYGVKSGDRFRWADTYCSRMVAGAGPRVAPESSSISAYCEAPIGRQIPIGAYLGVPLLRGDGSLFGTMCAVDPAPQPASLAEELPLVELLGKLLSALLAADADTRRN